MPVIRRIEPGDAELLRTVRLAALLDAPSAFGSTYEGERGRSEDEWTARATASSAGPDHATFLALDGSEAVGIVGVYRPEPAVDALQLVSMWTAPSVRRRGVGRALVQVAIGFARANGIAELSLWVTRGNDAAQSLYEAMGFTETGEHQPLPSDPCKDETRMVLRLQAEEG